MQPGSVAGGSPSAPRSLRSAVALWAALCAALLSTAGGCAEGVREGPESSSAPSLVVPRSGDSLSTTVVPSGGADNQTADTNSFDPSLQSGIASISPLVVRILDVGQGDAIFVENGSSRVFIDGGAEMRRFGAHLDRLKVNHDTVDLVVISHAHHDHYNGLRELFVSRRSITVRYLFESRDVSPNVTLIELRDSILARASGNALVYRDSDDPCGDGSRLCTVFLQGGAKLHIMRPDPAGDGPNNRSTPIKLVGPDSASFTMWFAGDAEHDAIAWFSTARYDTHPGMKVNVLKGNHHGSCNGISHGYMKLLSPDAVVFSLAAQNEYGYIHNQTKAILKSLHVPWYRTDQNGEITITSPGTPGGGYTIAVARGAPSSAGPSDRSASPTTCAR